MVSITWPQRQLARPTRSKLGIAPPAFQLCPTETRPYLSEVSWLLGWGELAVGRIDRKSLKVLDGQHNKID